MTLAFTGVGLVSVSRDCLLEHTLCGATFVPICFPRQPCELNAITPPCRRAAGGSEKCTPATEHAARV